MLAHRCTQHAARRSAMALQTAALSSIAHEQPLLASNLQVQRSQQSKQKVLKEELVFGKTFTDHMLEVDWVKGEGWGNPVIRPHGPLVLDPACAVFHYALECFEGLKAYAGPKGEIRLFRPDMNMKRLNRSMKRLMLPEFDGDELTECLKELLRLDRDWIPEGDGYSLYIRPTGISTEASVGVRASENAKLYIILSPVGPYYPEGFNPVKLHATDKFVRAWPGGTGGYKLGSNYAPGIMPQYDAAEKGYSQNLWIFGPDHEITEVGAMNLFIHWINENGEKELITPTLDRGDILPGITRDSILGLTREWNEFKVTEGHIKMAEVKKAVDEGRMIEIFGSGTAAVVSPVSTISYNGEDLQIPLDGTDGRAGKLAERVWKALGDIQYGRVEHPWSVRVD